VPLVLCLNEISCEAATSEIDAQHYMGSFVATLQAIRRCRPTCSLVTPVPLPGIPLATGYPMSRWAADNRNRDSWRFIRSLQNRAPFTYSELPGYDDLSVEYFHQGRPARGLGLAHGLDTMAVSLPAEPCWLLEWITVVRHVLTEVSSSIVEEDQLDVRHASTPEHASVHRQWLAVAGLANVSSGRQLWAERLDFFPSLSFLPRVEDDLAALDPRWLDPVRRRLAELQDALSAWDPSQDPFPAWRNVTPEHEQRQLLCRFHDVDGIERVFDLHARFTPGPGRLYFRLIREDATVRIAYIGRKLGA
jgi:hypothetical protein